MNTIIGRIAVALILSAAGIANAATAIVHSQRPGGDYAGWSLHVWGTGLGAGEATGWTSPKAFQRQRCLWGRPAPGTSSSRSPPSTRRRAKSAAA